MSNDGWGISFAGGGGKGAYQIGVWRALKQLNYEEKILGVSGSSVGALNALLFANQDLKNAESIWRSIRPIQFLDFGNFDFLTAKEGLIRGLFRQAKSQGLCSRDGLLSIIQNDVDLSYIASAPLEIYICVTKCKDNLYFKTDKRSLDDKSSSLTAVSLAENFFSQMGNMILDAACSPDERASVYVRLNDSDEDTIAKTLLASSAIPYIYEPVLIGNSLYRDGGLTDNVPIRPLVEHGLKNLIVVKLEPDDKVDTSLYPRCNHVIEITPSREIGDLLDGTLDFNPKSVPFRMELGYYDTLRAIDFFEKERAGITVTAAEQKQREEEDYQKAMQAVN